MALNLIGKIELDGAGFERGLHRAGEHVADFAKNAAVAAFGFYGVEESIRKTVETATELVNESKRLDLTVEQLQLLRQAAKDGGTEMDSLAGAFEKLNVARQKALSGSKDGQKISASFEKLGVTEQQLRTQTAAALFMGPLAHAVGTHNVADISKELKDILGKSFGAAIPVLKTDFDELSEKMHKLGSVMDADTAVKLKALGDNFELLKNIMAAQLGPVLLTFVEAILAMIGKIKGAAAFWGTITEHLETLTPETAKADVMTKNGSGKINFWKAIWAEMFEGGAAKPEVKNIPATEAAKAVEDDWTKTVDEMRKKLEKEAKDISHPKPIHVDEDESTPKGKKVHIPEDALVKVGNFLGANGQTIERVNQQKIALLKRIADTNDKILMKTQSSGGTFGTVSFPT
jgi:hypothetical protein